MGRKSPGHIKAVEFPDPWIEEAGDRGDVFTM